jgi:SHS2 domain-containing protein
MMYEIFEHTADLGLRIRSPSLDKLFEEAAAALFSVIVENPGDIRPERESSFQLEAQLTDELLRDWLGELLYRFHADHLLFSRFEVSVQDNRLTATAAGEKVDPARHQLDAEIKAVTYHGLKLIQQDDGWLAEVIVDI